MSCPCYSAIYSAATKFPAVVVAIISDYVHTFSDSDFERLIQTDRLSFMLRMNDNYHSYDFRGRRSDTFELTKPSLDWVFIKDWMNISKPPDPSFRWLSIHMTYRDVSSREFWSWADLYIDRFAWEFLQYHFGQDNDDYVARRTAIWRNLKSRDPDMINQMPEIFFTWCNQMLKVIGDELYNRPHTLVCPWSPDPKSKIQVRR